MRPNKPKNEQYHDVRREMTEGQTFGHAGSCDKAEDCRSGIGMTPDRHLPVTSTPELCENEALETGNPYKGKKTILPRNITSKLSVMKTKSSFSVSLKFYFRYPRTIQ